MTDDNEQPKDAPIAPTKVLTFTEFLETYPVNSWRTVSEFCVDLQNGYDEVRRMSPVLRLHCPECQGVRNFSGEWDREDCRAKDGKRNFLQYTCKDCEKTTKTFCLLSAAERNSSGLVMKVGEYPEQHLDLPRSVNKLLGDDYSLFTKGLKCERLGLGIGAFTYYRRVVDSQKDHLIGEILRVAKKLAASPENIAKIEAARKQNSFDRAVETIKDAIPESLLVNGHNPLTLLNGALSSGLHAESDEDCLSIAHSIRLVLVDLSKRLKAALGEQSKLKSAISDLMKFSSKSKRKAKGDGDGDEQK